MTEKEEYKKAVRHAVKTVKNATQEEMYEYFAQQFKKNLYRPTFKTTLGANHYALDIFADITVCGKIVSGWNSNRNSIIFWDCPSCRRTYKKVLERYIHEEIFALNPTDPLEGFISLNKKAKEVSKNFTEAELVSYIVKLLISR